MTTRAFVVDTGAANIASVCNCLRRLGVEPVLAHYPPQIESAELLVLPGVGAFESAMTRLHQLGLEQSLVRRIEAGRPTLTICLGLQLLCDASDEGNGVRGLGVLPATIRRFDDSLPVPQLGWNEIEPAESCELLTPGWAVFANSYYLGEIPEGWSGAFTEYSTRFVSAVERGAVLACQFHPELSGEWGQALLARWIERAKAA